jgi:DNA-binding CsgD family transcriptional regulator
VTKHVIDQFTRTPRRERPKQLDDLTEGELEVLGLIARGLSNAEIAEQVFISDTTVKTHITHILQSSTCETGFKQSYSPTDRPRGLHHVGLTEQPDPAKGPDPDDGVGYGHCSGRRVRP